MPTSTDPALLAAELRVVLGQLIRRLRAEHRFPLSHGNWQDADPAKTYTGLPQAGGESMAQTVSDLETDGLVARRPDPSDGRRALVSLTDEGRAALDADRRHRDGWLALAIADDLTPDEQAVLARAAELLRRIAET